MARRNKFRMLWTTAGLTFVSAVGVGVSRLSQSTDHTAATAAATYAANVLATLGFETAKRWWEACTTKTDDGTEASDLILRGLRQAQLLALRDVLVRWNESRKMADMENLLLRLDKLFVASADLGEGNYDKTFAEWLDCFLSEEEHAAATLTWAALTEPNEVPVTALTATVAQHLPEDASAAFASRHGSGAMLDAWRVPAEKAMLAELRSFSKLDIPAGFADQFGGTSGGQGGWFALFVRNFTSRLESDAEFERVWNRQQLAVLSNLLTATAEGVKTLLAKNCEVTEQLKSFGTALRAIAGSLEAVTAAVAQIDAQIKGSDRNWLHFNIEIKAKGFLRFSPFNPRVPFLGRAEQMAALQQFLSDGQPFAWWLAVGPGGAGKTRLALELCWWAHARQWQVGFLDRDEDGRRGPLPDNSWLPKRPTLIVADYAGANIAKVRELAKILARTGNKDLPVTRLLMLERQAGEDFWRRFYGPTFTDRGLLELHCFAPAPLEVPELPAKDVWELARCRLWQEEPTELKVDPERFLERLGEIDRHRRVLVAMILADAPDLGLGLADMLRAFLDRSRELYWPKPMPIESDLLISAATVVGRLDGALLQEIDDRRGRVTSDALKRCASAIGSRFDDGQRALTGIQPDLIGDFYALETLAGTKLDGPPYPWLPEALWRARPAAMLQFCDRAIKNFPDHKSKNVLAVTFPDVPESWMLQFWLAVEEDGEWAAGFSKGRMLLWSKAAANLGAARAFTWLTALTVSADIRSDEEDIAAQMLVDLSDLLDQPFADAKLREEWACIVSDFIDNRATTQPVHCDFLIRQLSLLGEAYPIAQPSPHFDASGVIGKRPKPDAASANLAISGASRCSGMVGISS